MTTAGLVVFICLGLLALIGAIVGVNALDSRTRRERGLPPRRQRKRKGIRKGDRE